MKAFVVYESSYGNTRRIAEAVAAGIRAETAFDVTLIHAGEAPKALTCDLLVVGAPTHVFGLPKPATRAEAVKTVSKRGDKLTVEPGATGTGVAEWLGAAALSAGLAAAFDTRVPLFGFAGHAATRITKALKRHATVAEPESFLVTKENTLLDGQLERAGAWGTQLAAQTIGLTVR